MPLPVRACACGSFHGNLWRQRQTPTPATLSTLQAVVDVFDLKVAAEVEAGAGSAAENYVVEVMLPSFCDLESCVPQLPYPLNCTVAVTDARGFQVCADFSLQPLPACPPPSTAVCLSVCLSVFLSESACFVPGLACLFLIFFGGVCLSVVCLCYFNICTLSPGNEITNNYLRSCGDG